MNNQQLQDLTFLPTTRKEKVASGQFWREFFGRDSPKRLILILPKAQKVSFHFFRVGEAKTFDKKNVFLKTANKNF